MKTFLIVCLLFPVLAFAADSNPTAKPAPTTAAPVKCEVTDEKTGQPSSTVCSDGACVNTRESNTLNGTDKKVILFQTCGKQDSCALAFSITVGEGKTLATTSACCTADDCNKNLILPEPSAPVFENKLVCPVGCFASDESKCNSSKVSCTGGENKCVNLTAKNNDNSMIVLKGCGTQSACNLKASSTLFLNGKFYTVDKADECKNATSSSLSVLGHSLGRGVFPLLLPGISSILLAKFLC